MSDIDDAEAFLDQLDRRNRRARIVERPKRRAVHTRRVRAKAVRAHRKVDDRPLYGPPAPPNFTSKTVQAKAAESRKGLRNAARSEADKDAECEAVLGILQSLAPRPVVPVSVAQAFAAWANNGGTK